MGKGCDIIIREDGKIYFEDSINLNDYCYISAINGKIKIGSGSFFNAFCKITSLLEIEIGENSIFGPNVQIYDHDHEFEDSKKPIKEQGYKLDKVKIGSNVWIGANTVITSGVIIGDHVIIGANSVVTKNLSSHSVYTGVPAKKIKDI